LAISVDVRPTIFRSKVSTNALLINYDDLVGVPGRTRVLLDQFRGPHEFPMRVPTLAEESTGIFRELCARTPTQLCGYFVALESQLRAVVPDSPAGA
jgi:hypothetical protein